MVVPAFSLVFVGLVQGAAIGGTITGLSGTVVLQTGRTADFAREMQWRARYGTQNVRDERRGIARSSPDQCVCYS